MDTNYKRGNTFTAQFSVNGSRRQFALGTSNKRSAGILLGRLETAKIEGRWNPLSETPDAILRPKPESDERPDTQRDRMEAFLRSRTSLRFSTQ